MCGIVAAIAERNVTPILIEGLKRLEYRGYDSAGLAVLSDQGIACRRAVGKVAEVEKRLQMEPISGHIGIAHTRWATHGAPAERNAHLHVSFSRLAVVYNGIIENRAELRERLIAKDYEFASETDTEVAAHWIEYHLRETGDVLQAVQRAVQQFEGAYALGVISTDEPERLIAAREGSPLVIGVGIGEYFIASDAAALLPVTQHAMSLEDGDVAEIRRDAVHVFDWNGQPTHRESKLSNLTADAVEFGEFRHYMLKEIHEQPRAVADTLGGRISEGRVLVDSVGDGAREIFAKVRRMQIVASGTSYHAGMVARYWFEDILGLPCQVEMASEFRYRNPVVSDDALFVTISQSGETADTLAALQKVRAKRTCMATLAICNVPESSLVRSSDLAFMTHAGPEIGVASTKSFTTQLSLALIVASIGKLQGRLTARQELDFVNSPERVPARVTDALRHGERILELAGRIVSRPHSLFLGRGEMFPIALEGALKLKEISYIHAEAYPAGELKHGPLALLDDCMPVIAIAPQNDLLSKLKSNLEEVLARGGELFCVR